MFMNFAVQVAILNMHGNSYGTSFLLGWGGGRGEFFSLSNMPSQEEPMHSSIYLDALLATHPQVKFEAWPSGV